LGSKGMLGSELLHMLRELGHDAVGFSRGSLDFESSTSLGTALGDFDIIINCIAYTRVDRAETEPEEAAFANFVIPRRISTDLASVGSRLIHISTDYVFSGNASAPYQVHDRKDPLGVYGRTKSEGEDAWLSGSDFSQVVRTAWLYGSHGNCFPKTIAKNLVDGKAVQVVDNQAGSPTWTRDLAEFIVRVALEPIQSRTLHGVASGATTWYEFARTIAADLDVLVPERRPLEFDGFQGLVQPRISESPSSTVKRPRFGILNPSTAGGYQIPNWKLSWHFSATTVLEELLGGDSGHTSSERPSL
jgi:dTDP-4-dehydrorhamnose reductase